MKIKQNESLNRMKRIIITFLLLTMVLPFFSSFIHARSTNTEKGRNINHKENSSDELQVMRMEIDSLDAQLIDVLSKRMQVCVEVGKYKKEHYVAVVQSDRFKQILEDRCKKGSEKGLDENFILRIMNLIHDESVRQQKALLKE